MTRTFDARRRDIRETALYREVARFYEQIHAPGTDQVTDAAEISVRPDGVVAAFTGSLYRSLDMPPATRICLVNLQSRRLHVQSSTTGNDRLPRWSPDGTRLAFLSDRRESGNFQLYLTDGAGVTEPPLAAPEVDGVIEYLQWSPDGGSILLGVAGYGADFAGCQGGHKTLARGGELPSWAPLIESDAEENLWRRLFVFDIARGTVRLISPPGTNFWEACWLGNGRVAAVTSRSHSEGSWYDARIQCLEVGSGKLEVVFTPTDQVGVLAGSPSGQRLAFVEAVCSDRMIVAGTLNVLSLDRRSVSAVGTLQADVTCAEWRDEERLTYAGIRSLETIIGEVDVGARPVGRECWASREKTIGGWNPVCAPLPAGGAIAVSEAYDTPPAITVFEVDTERTILSLAAPATAQKGFGTARVEPLTWRARDGLQIQGWLIHPPGAGPFPLVMDIHGGPVWCCRNRWQGRLRGAKVLADHGIASFYPNPRGSSGRGQEFARRVKGEMGGEDTYDYLTGIDALVSAGIADPKRLAVTGISYGGFMSAWLITQDDRFAAAAPISCVSDWYSEYLTSQIGDFVRLFLDSDPAAPHGRMFDRSPAMFAHKVRTPTLQLTGAQDQNTPPTQALEFHRGLMMQGVTTVLATYPAAGHGIRTFPEVIDATARYVGWMLQHLQPELTGG
jgi:dipeptidyl aminopeptidase/acylaminoacyl peptidase